MNTGLGLYMLDSNGKVYTVGAAVDRGGAESLLQAGESAISIASAGSSASYIITTNLGKIIPKGGDVTYRGGLSNTALPSPISHIAKMGHLTDNSDGYWLVTFSGKIYKFGAAAFYGDSSAKELTQVYVPPKPAPTPSPTTTTDSGGSDGSDDSDATKTEDGYPDGIEAAVQGSRCDAVKTSWNSVHNSLVNVAKRISNAPDKKPISSSSPISYTKELAQAKFGTITALKNGIASYGHITLGRSGHSFYAASCGTISQNDYNYAAGLTGNAKNKLSELNTYIDYLTGVRKP